jgi:putative ABC transport system permease protein
MSLLIGSLTIGLILSLLTLGVYISFRVFNFPDITVDGSITLGAAIAAVLLVKGFNPIAATFGGALGGFIAGIVTGILHTRFKIHGLLSGILVMTALYSINLHVMGRSNVPLLSEQSLATMTEKFGMSLAKGSNSVILMGWEVPVRDIAMLIGCLGLIAVVAMILYLFFKTDLGTIMRATGDNDQMVRAMGTNTGTMITLGLGLSNFLVAFSGALLAQYQGFADVQMGIGMVVWGLASVIIGGALVRTRHLGLAITGAIMGSILFRLLIAIALRFGLNPNDMKLITALFVFGALVLPNLLERIRSQRGVAQHA